MKRCKNCKWWEADTSEDEWASCGLADSYNANPEHETSKAIAYDFEGYMAHLQTHKTFGCVQWEKRE